MDRAELTKEDITALLDWRDEHKDLVRQLPAPLKALEIVFRHNDYRIKGIRQGERLKLYLSKGFESLGHAEMEIDGEKRLIHRKGRMKIDKDSFQSVLTVYCSLMALMTYGELVPEEDQEPQKESTPHKPHKQPHKKKGPRTTYILRRNKGAITVAPKGSHAKPSGVFTVRGHYRHYKSGKVIWISEFKKGTGKKKRKTYRMGGEKDDGRKAT